MARDSNSSTNSSELDFRPDIFEPSINEPMPIQPPDTSYLTSMPEFRQSNPKVLHTGDVLESRWKPLVGTPSKPPIPEDVFVPDPSPARTFSDTASTTMLPPSTPGSFIHQRRQGEYVPRPPVWTLYNMDGTVSSSPDPPELTYLSDASSADEAPFVMKPAYMLKNENRKLSMHSFKLSDSKRWGVIFNEQYMEMCDTFREMPLIVNMMQTSSRSRSPLLNASQSSNEVNPREISPTLTPPDHASPDLSAETHEVVHTYSEELQSEPNLQPNAVENAIAHGSGGTGSPAHSHSYPEPLAEADSQSNTMQSGMANESTEHGGTDIAAHSQSSLRDPNMSQSNLPAENAEDSTSQDFDAAELSSSHSRMPYDMIEGPGRSIERLSHYVDIRAKLTPEQSNPLANKMVEGSEVSFIGLTWLSDGSEYEFGLATDSRYLVAEIYGDFWALLIKVEPGLELAEIHQSSFFGWKPKPKPPRKNRMPEKKPLIGIRTDRRLLVYAPLCAFTLAMDNRASRSQSVSRGSDAQDSTSSHGGLAQASTRSHSEMAQIETIDYRFTYIPKAVYEQYLELCKPLQPKLLTTTEPPAPRGTENTNPSLRSDAEASPPHQPSRSTNLPLRPKSQASQIPSGATSTKNTPARNIKEFFSRKKDYTPVAYPKAKLNEPVHPPRPQYGEGAGSPQEESAVIAASAPQVQLLSLPQSFENISLTPPSDCSGQIPPCSGGLQPQSIRHLVKDTSLSREPVLSDDSIVIARGESLQPQRIRNLVKDTSLSREPVLSDDSIVSARGESLQPSTELSITHKRTYMRSSSGDPTPKPMHRSPLVRTPSLPPRSDEGDGEAVATKKSDRLSKYETVFRSATGSIRKMIPAALQGLKPASKKEKPKQKKSHTGSATHLVQQAAQSWKDFKAKRQHRKSILQPDIYQPPGTETDQNPQQRCFHDVSTMEGNEELQRRLAATSPLPTTWSSISTAGNDVPPGTAANANSEVSHLPAPGRLGDHLMEIAPDTTLRARLNKSTSELGLVRQS